MVLRQDLSSIRRGVGLPDEPPVTGIVTRVDASGIWAVELDGDRRTPDGPCRAPVDDLEVGDVVLIVRTSERPWVIPDRSTPI